MQFKWLAWSSLVIAPLSLSMLGCCKSTADVAKMASGLREANEARSERAIAAYLANDPLVWIEAERFLGRGQSGLRVDVAVAPEPAAKGEPAPELAPTEPPKGASARYREAFFKDSASGRLVFAHDDCALREGCEGCEVPLRYRYGKRASGGLVIARVAPQIKYTSVSQCGECSGGCGMAVVEVPPARDVLPVNDAADVEIVDIPVVLDTLSIDCSRPSTSPP